MYDRIAGWGTDPVCRCHPGPCRAPPGSVQDPSPGQVERDGCRMGRDSFVALDTVPYPTGWAVVPPRSGLPPPGPLTAPQPSSPARSRTDRPPEYQPSCPIGTGDRWGRPGTRPAPREPPAGVDRDGRYTARARPPDFVSGRPDPAAPTARTGPSPGGLEAPRRTRDAKERPRQHARPDPRPLLP